MASEQLLRDGSGMCRWNPLRPPSSSEEAPVLLPARNDLSCTQLLLWQSWHFPSGHLCCKCEKLEVLGSSTLAFSSVALKSTWKLAKELGIAIVVWLVWQVDGIQANVDFLESPGHRGHVATCWIPNELLAVLALCETIRTAFFCPSNPEIPSSLSTCDAIILVCP